MNEEKKIAQVETKEANDISDSGSTKAQGEPPQIVYKEMADEAPEPLLYGFRTERGGLSTERWPNGWRILQNGEIWFCWNWAYIPVEGKYVLHAEERLLFGQKGRAIRLPRIWRHWGEVATLEEIEKIREFVRKNKVLELPDEVRGEGGCIGGTNVFFTVEVDGKRRTILWTQCGDQPPEPLRSLEELANVIEFQASRRWGEKYRAVIEEL